MKVVITGLFCQASDISMCVVFYFMAFLTVHAFIACYMHVLDATRMHARATIPRVFLCL